MDPVRSLYYIEPQMGHVTMFCTSWILDRALIQRRLCLVFVKIMEPGKWDIIMRYRVIATPKPSSTDIGESESKLGDARFISFYFPCY